MSIGMKLKALRISKKKTQQAAADEMKITKSALAMYERDNRVPRDEIKVVIAKYYGESVEAIFLAAKSTNSARLNDLQGATMEMLFFIAYVVIASASIFGLLVAAAKFTGSDMEFPIGWVLCGIFWPVALLPAIGYIAAGWYLNREREE